MNSLKLLTLAVTVLIELEALALLSFPSPENLLVTEQEETDENLDEDESEGPYEPQRPTGIRMFINANQPLHPLTPRNESQSRRLPCAP